MGAYGAGVTDDLRTLLFDPQTAGGLLIAVAPDDAQALLHALRERGIQAVTIGEVLAARTPLIEVVLE